MPSIKSDSVYLLLSERGTSSNLVPAINSFSMDSSDGFTSGYMVVTDSSKLTKATLFTWVGKPDPFLCYAAVYHG